MFWRILWRLLSASRGRLTLALVIVTSGAAVSAALLNLNLDASNKLTREFRSLGANVIVSPAEAAESGGPRALIDAAVVSQLSALHEPRIIAAAPYVYVAAKTGDAADAPSVIVAGTSFDEVARINSWWKIDGHWVTGSEDFSACMVGREAARSLGLSPGGRLTLRYAGREASLVVAGVITAGGSEDNQVFVHMKVAQDLAGLGDRIGLVQVSVRGSASEIESVMRHISQAVPGVQVLPVRQLAAAEGRLLERIRGLLFATVLLILLLTALGVLAAMAGLALERRSDVGLMKALGGSVRRIMRFFLAEATAIGLAGGLMGCALGMVLSGWIGQRVFNVAITPRLIVVPITLALMIAVALAGALPLRLLGRVRPAEILRGE
jgi:putative ABC transport system permease protein